MIARNEFSGTCSHCGAPTGLVDPVFDDVRCKVIVEGELRHMQPNAWDALWVLRERFGRLVSKETLMRLVYGAKEMPSDKAVDVYLCQIRRALKGSPYEVETVWGRGVRLVRTDRDSPIPAQAARDPQPARALA